MGRKKDMGGCDPQYPGNKNWKCISEAMKQSGSEKAKYINEDTSLYR